MLVGELSGMRTGQARARAAELLELFELADAADRVAKGYSQGARPSLPGDTRAPAMPHDTTSKEPGNLRRLSSASRPGRGRPGPPAWGPADKFEVEGPMAVQEITYPSGAGRGRAAAVAVGAGG